MEIVPITKRLMKSAAAIHAASWQDSHRRFCTAAFVAEHDERHQLEYLLREKARGKSLYILLAPEPAGLVSVFQDCIENLYVHPAMQGKGYGTALIQFAMAKCVRPALWVLENNLRAIKLYHRLGFQFTGRRNAITPALNELEMAFQA